MKRILTVSTAMCLVAFAAFANPIQIGNKGPASQVYGEGSAASSAASNSNSSARVGNTSARVGNTSATVGNTKATGGKASVTVNVTNSPSSSTSNTANAPASGTPGSSGTQAATGRTNGSGSHGYGSGHGSNGGSGSNGSASGNVGYSGPNLPVATAYAPTVTSFNSCAGSPVSAGVQGASFGLSFGSGNKFDRVCWLNESGRSDAAIEYICAVDRTAREAMKHTAHPCAEDVQQVTTAAQTVYGHDWCYTRDAGNARQAEECNHPPVTTQQVSASAADDDDHGWLWRQFH